MRVHVTGGPGSGKTTLGRRIASALEIPHVDLDAAAYIPGMTWAQLHERRLALIDQLWSLDGVVTEGSFVEWAQPVFERAEIIVFLEVRVTVALTRIVKRHVIASLRRANPYTGVRRLARFLLLSWHWYRGVRTRDELRSVTAGTTGISNLQDTLEFAQQYGERVVRCRTRRDVDRVYDLITAGKPARITDPT